MHEAKTLHVAVWFAVLAVGASSCVTERCPYDATSPIHTDATVVDTHERLTLTITGSQVTIRSEQGYYLTPVDGGGLTGTNQALHTDGQTLDVHETFTLERL